MSLKQLRCQQLPAAGKTRVLTYRCRYLLEGAGNDSDQALILAFTNKAADEIRERCINYGLEPNRIFCGTLHDFALQQVCIPNKSSLGFKDFPEILPDNERLAFVYASLIDIAPDPEDITSLPQKKLNQKLRDLTAQISSYKRQSFSNGFNADHHILTPLIEAYDSYMMESNGIDYDDVILLAIKVLQEFPGKCKLLRRRFRHVMVDEAQDLNELQYNMVMMLMGEESKSFLMVGDPNQSIYAFNGADHTLFTNRFVKTYGALEMSISKNYRSSAAVLKVADLLKPNSTPHDPYFEGEKTFTAYVNEKDEADAIVSQCRDLISKKRLILNGVTIEIGAQSIGILTRTAYGLTAIQEALEAKGMGSSYTFRRRAASFKPTSEIVQFIIYVLRGISNPRNALSRSHAISLNSSLVNAEFSSAVELVRSFAELIRISPSKMLDGFSDFKESILLELKAMPHDLLFTVASEIAELHFIIRNYVKSNPSSTTSLAGLLAYMNLAQVEDPTTPIVLSSIHASKGLEYDILFLPGLAHGVLPYYLASSASENAEEKNLAYVAVTRAKIDLHMSYPKSRIMPWGDAKTQSPSSFFRDLVP